MATVRDFPPDFAQSDGALDCDVPLSPFLPFKISAYTELAGALDLPVHQSNENVQPSSQAQGVTDWFSIPVSYDPDHNALASVIPTALGNALVNFEGPIAQFDFLLQTKLDPIEAPFSHPSSAPPYNPFNVQHLPEIAAPLPTYPPQARPYFLSYPRGQHNVRSPSPDNQEHQLVLPEGTKQRNEDTKTHGDSTSSDCRTLSPPRLGMYERVFKGGQSPSPSRSVSGLPVLPARYSMPTDGKALHDVPPSDGDRHNDTPSFSEAEALPDVTPTPNVFTGVTPPPDRDIDRGSVPSDGDSVDDIAHSDGDSEDDMALSDGDSEDGMALSDGDSEDDMVPSEGAVFPGNIGDHVQKRQDGRFECIWRCGFVSKRMLVIRHIRRMHYLEK